MDTSHVALVSLNLSMEGFESYRCDQPVVLGININNLSKVMKLADPSDSITLQCEQDPSTLKITFENPKTQRSTEFALNLITLDVEHLSIPETEYSSSSPSTPESSQRSARSSSLSQSLSPSKLKMTTSSFQSTAQSAQASSKFNRTKETEKRSRP